MWSHLTPDELLRLYEESDRRWALVARKLGVNRNHLRKVRVRLGVKEENRSRAGKLCSVEGCGLPVEGRGLCNSHYQRLMYARRNARAAAESVPFG